VYRERREPKGQTGDRKPNRKPNTNQTRRFTENLEVRTTKLTLQQHLLSSQKQMIHFSGDSTHYFDNTTIFFDLILPRELLPPRMHLPCVLHFFSNVRMRKRRPRKESI